MPRITLRLDRETYDALKQHSDALRVDMSTLARNCIPKCLTLSSDASTNHVPASDTSAPYVSGDEVTPEDISGEQILAMMDQRGHSNSCHA